LRDLRATCHAGRSLLVLVTEGYRKEGEMRIFVARATGVIGRRLVPMLVGAGHRW
jgi:hypothetical protein